MHSSVMRLPTCSVRGPTTHHPIVLCTARHGLGLPFRVRSRSALGPGLRMALPRNPHASLHAQLRRALANLFRVWARHTLPSCPLHGPSVSVSARSVHGSAVHLRVYSVYGTAAHYPLVRYTASRPVHGPATHVPAPSVHGRAVGVASSPVYGPAVHFAPGL